MCLPFRRHGISDLTDTARGVGLPHFAACSIEVRRAAEVDFGECGEKLIPVDFGPPSRILNPRTIAIADVIQQPVQPANPFCRITFRLRQRCRRRESEASAPWHDRSRASDYSAFARQANGPR